MDIETKKQIDEMLGKSQPFEINKKTADMIAKQEPIKKNEFLEAEIDEQFLNEFKAMCFKYNRCFAVPPGVIPQIARAEFIKQDAK